MTYIECNRKNRLQSFLPFTTSLYQLYSHFIMKNIILLLPPFLQNNKIWQTATKRLLSYVCWKCTTNDISYMYIFCEASIRLQNLHFFSRERGEILKPLLQHKVFLTRIIKNTFTGWFFPNMQFVLFCFDIAILGKSNILDVIYTITRIGILLLYYTITMK